MSAQRPEYQDNDYEQEISGLQSGLARFPHESFDVSSFTQSKAGVDIPSRYLASGFPVINAPTYELSPDVRIDYGQKMNKNEIEDYISSSNQKNERGRIEQLERIIKEKQQMQQSNIQKIKQLNEYNLKLEKLIRERDMIIREKEEIILVQEKSLKKNIENSGVSSANRSKDKSKASNVSYIDQFCPEFLSPEESLQLFTELLCKIEKSTSMRKKISKNKRIVEILHKMVKEQ